MMNAGKMNTIEEHEIGNEDRVFLARETVNGTPLVKPGWFWQCRGSVDAIGPFSTRKEAESNYNSSGIPN